MQIDLRIKRNMFNDAYYPYLFDYSNRFNVYYGGAGSGKSHFIVQKLLLKLLKSKRKLLVIRKVGRTNRDSTFQLFLDVLSKFKLLSECNVNLSNLTLTLPNNSILLFRGLDDSEKIKSITGITDIWIEESTEINVDDFTQLNLRLRADVPEAQVYLSFNPVSKANWCYKYWFENKQENTFILKTTYLDNKFLPSDFVDTLSHMKVNNPTYFKIYALGDFCTLDKLIYNNYKEELFNHTDINGELIIGLDFGFVNDMSALIASIVDETNKIIYVFDEWTDKGKTNDYIAEIIKNKGFSKSLIIADSAEMKSIEELKKHGIYRIRASVKGQGSILQGIQKLQQYQLIVHPKCQQTIIELQNYAWKKDKQTGEYINTPIDEFNHCLDALRYSLQCVTTLSQLKSISKNIL